MHFRNPPFNHVTKELIVDVIVLAADRTLCTLLQLVLTITADYEVPNEADNV